MRILMLNYEFPPIGGGAGKAHLCILKEYAGIDDLQIDVLTSAPKPGFVVDEFAENITIYKVGVHKRDLHYWRKIEVIEWLAKAAGHYRKLLRANKYDLAHAFFAFPTGWLCYRTAKKLPYVISLRGSDVPGYNVRLGLDYKLFAGLFKRIWVAAAAIIANSQGLRQLALAFMPQVEIGVIPNAVYTDRFYPREQMKLSQPLKALTVCRLISRKQIDLLIESVAKAKKLDIEVELTIVGEGNLMNCLQKLAGKLDLAEQVRFAGRVPYEQMPQVYRDSDFFVMASEHEGMSNAMLEAMASGLPIITTRCEGVQELIADNGIVLDEASADSIAAAIKQLANDEQGYKTMCTAARNRAQIFDWKSVARQYLQCYQSISAPAK